MIPVTPAPEPPNFDEDVRQPGLWAIAEMVGKRPRPPRTHGKPHAQIARRKRDIPAEKFPPLWKKALRDLMAAYDEICAYSFCTDRAQDAEEYWNGEVALSKLRRESPFVAHELKRQKRLLPGDRW